jgi:hypothetical protein
VASLVDGPERVRKALDGTPEAACRIGARDAQRVVATATTCRAGHEVLYATLGRYSPTFRPTRRPLGRCRSAAIFQCDGGERRPSEEYPERTITLAETSFAIVGRQSRTPAPPSSPIQCEVRAAANWTNLHEASEYPPWTCLQLKGLPLGLTTHSRAVECGRVGEAEDRPMSARRACGPWLRRSCGNNRGPKLRDIGGYAGSAKWKTGCCRVYLKISVQHGGRNDSRPA